MSVNKTILLGRLGGDPVLKETPTGNVCNFNLATTENWTDKVGAKQERTEWHKIVVWGNQAKPCADYLSKGREAYVEGKLRTRNYEDKSGVTKYITEVNATDVQFVGKPNKDTAKKEAQPKQDYKVIPRTVAENDIPF